MRIETDHLEVGDTINEGIMYWPTGDKNDKQRWRLFFSVTASDVEEWTPEVDLEWVGRSDTVQFQVAEPGNRP